MIDTITVIAEKCECGRLFKGRRDENGETMCSACFTELSLEALKALWSTPIPKTIKEIWKK